MRQGGSGPNPASRLKITAGCAAATGGLCQLLSMCALGALSFDDIDAVPPTGLFRHIQVCAMAGVLLAATGMSLVLSGLRRALAKPVKKGWFDD